MSAPPNRREAAVVQALAAVGAYSNESALVLTKVGRYLAARGCTNKCPTSVGVGRALLDGGALSPGSYARVDELERLVESVERIASEPGDGPARLTLAGLVALGARLRATARSETPAAAESTSEAGPAVALPTLATREQIEDAFAILSVVRSHDGALDSKVRALWARCSDAEHALAKIKEQMRPLDAAEEACDAAVARCTAVDRERFKDALEFIAARAVGLNVDGSVIPEIENPLGNRLQRINAVAVHVLDGGAVVADTKGA